MNIENTNKVYFVKKVAGNSLTAEHCAVLLSNLNHKGNDSSMCPMHFMELDLKHGIS